MFCCDVSEEGLSASFRWPNHTEDGGGTFLRNVETNQVHEAVYNPKDNDRMDNYLEDLKHDVTLISCFNSI